MTRLAVSANERAATDDELHGLIGIFIFGAIVVPGNRESVLYRSRECRVNFFLGESKHSEGGVGVAILVVLIDLTSCCERESK